VREISVEHKEYTPLLIIDSAGLTRDHGILLHFFRG